MSSLRRQLRTDGRPQGGVHRLQTSGLSKMRHHRVTQQIIWVSHLFTLFPSRKLLHLTVIVVDIYSFYFKSLFQRSQGPVAVHDMLGNEGDMEEVWRVVLQELAQVHPAVGQLLADPPQAAPHVEDQPRRQGGGQQLRRGEAGVEPDQEEELQHGEHAR